MSQKGPRSLADLLLTGDIAKLRHHATQRRELTEKIRAMLPDEQATHLVSASIDADGALVLGMDSATWAAKVRYGCRTLDGRAVRVKVVP